MRQAGILAAAGRYALEHNIQRLAQDHENARQLAEKLAQINEVDVDVGKVNTNMIYMFLPEEKSLNYRPFCVLGILLSARQKKAFVWYCIKIFQPHRQIGWQRGWLPLWPSDILPDLLVCKPVFFLIIKIQNWFL